MMEIVAGIWFYEITFIHEKELRVLIILINLNLPEHFTYVDVAIFVGYTSDI